MDPMQPKARWTAVMLLCSSCWWPSYAIQAAGSPVSSAKRLPAPQDRVDINHASIDELMKVPGMTRTWAGRIVRFRPYRAKTDLLENGIVTSEVYNRIKDFVIAHRSEN